MNMPINMPTAKLTPFAKGLCGKSAIVTGSTSGIGLGITYALAQAGVNVVLNGFGEPAGIEKTRFELERAFGVKTVYSSADVSKPADIAGMIEDGIGAFGQIDILVNNAGIFHVESTENVATENWDATIAINLSSAFHAIRAVLPGMKSRRWGRIVNIASALGLVGSPNASAYTASKHGIVGLTKTVALETADHRITVNAICPGYVLTPLIESETRKTAKDRGLPEEQVKAEFLRNTQPTRRFVYTSELGALAAFLCTDAAASITGAALSVDGGWTAR